MTPDVLAFADKKSDGALEVSEPSGTVVARILTSFWSSSKFTAETASGEPLCSARSSFFGGTWYAEDASGRPIATVQNGFWGTSRTVTLADERVLTLRGRMFSRDWSLVDADEQPVLSSTPYVSSWSFNPDAWLVRSHDASLDLAHVVGIVQVNRMFVKAARRS